MYERTVGRSTRFGLVLLAAAIVLGAFSASAMAAGTTVSRTSAGKIKVIAEAGWTSNSFTIKRIDSGSGTIQIVDGTYTMAAQSPCWNVTGYKVRCPISGTTSLKVRARAGNDEVFLTNNLRLGLVELYGGRDLDYLSGGPNGGGWLNLGCRLFGDEDKDLIVGCELGGYLSGGGGNDLIVGFGGNDWVFGGPGADQLWGQEGNDWLSGDKGADQLWAKDGEKDTVDCGPGVNDVLRNADPIDTVRNCES